MLEAAIRPDTWPDLAGHALEAAGIGGWDYDPATARLRWTPVTFRIHELPPGEPPALENAMAFYAPESRAIVAAAMRRALAEGAGWDLELPFVTARGRAIWVRSCGQATRAGGRTVRLTGAIQDITARCEMARQHELFSLVARQTHNAIVVTDAAGRVTWVNDACERMSGYSMADFNGCTSRALLCGPDTDPVTLRYMEMSLARGDGYEVEVLFYTRRGEPFWVAANCAPLRRTPGTLDGFITLATDITRRRRAETEARAEAQERRRTEALLRDVLEALPSAVTVYDRDDRFILKNPAYVEMFPIAARFAQPGRALRDIVAQAAAAGQYPDAGDTPEARAQWAAGCVAEHQAPGAVRIVRLPNGNYVQARQRRSQNGNLVCVRSDATELVHAEAELRLAAERDPLTLLANRATLLRALEKALRPQPDKAPGAGALLLFDLDDFKQVNDRFGHDVGDALLLEIAERLRLHTRSGDVAARLGGDEFAVVMPGLDDDRAVRARVEAIHAALAAPAQIGLRRLAVTISAGVTLFPRDGQDAARLLKNADLALYDAKNGGRARWCRFRPEHARAQERYVRRADALRAAVARDEIQIALQPKRRLAGGHAGFEALARWREADRWVPPSEFVALAEESGLGVALGRRVLHAALSRIAALRAQGLATGRVAVNVTAPQLLDSAFLGETLAMLRRHGLEPADLELELTETVLLGRGAEKVVRALRDLRARGIALALDDFGTGFASLAHLSHLPIDRLKIDRRFIAGIGAPGRGEIITRTVIGLARGLEMESVAEGVETEAQLAFLRAEGCDALQGYIVAKPMITQEEAAAYLRSADSNKKEVVLF